MTTTCWGGQGIATPHLGYSTVRPRVSGCKITESSKRHSESNILRSATSVWSLLSGRGRVASRSKTR